jgi:hypothetical protein
VRTAADLAGAPGAQQPGVPPGGYIHNGAIFDAQDRIVGYVPQAPSGPPPAPGQPNPEGYVVPPTQQPQQPQGGGVLGIGDWMSQMVLGHRPAAAPAPTPQAPIDANTLAMMQQMLTPTQIFENQRQQQFAEPRPSSGRTGPEPSEGAPRGGAQPTLGMLSRILGVAPGRPSSRRTGPEPSEGAGVRRDINAPTGGPTGGRGPLRLWNQGDKQPDQQTAQTMLRMLLGGRGEGEGGGAKRTGSGGKQGAISGKQGLYFGTHRASPVDTYRATQRGIARRTEREARQTRYDQNMAYRNIYGRDYWRARGYTAALQQMGITPTSVALANRTGGLGTMMGR